MYDMSLLVSETAVEMPARTLLRSRRQSQRFHQGAGNSNHTVISQSGIGNNATVTTTQLNLLLGFASQAQG
jgi:hypothetical protein